MVPLPPVSLKTMVSANWNRITPPEMQKLSNEISSLTAAGKASDQVVWRRAQIAAAPVGNRPEAGHVTKHTARRAGSH